MCTYICILCVHVNPFYRISLITVNAGIFLWYLEHRKIPQINRAKFRKEMFECTLMFVKVRQLYSQERRWIDGKNISRFGISIFRSDKYA